MPKYIAGVAEGDVSDSTGIGRRWVGIITVSLGLVLLDLWPVQPHKSQRPGSPLLHLSHCSIHSVATVRREPRYSSYFTWSANACTVVLASRLGSARPKQCAVIDCPQCTVIKLYRKSKEFGLHTYICVCVCLNDDVWTW